MAGPGAGPLLGLPVRGHRTRPARLRSHRLDRDTAYCARAMPLHHIRLQRARARRWRAGGNMRKGAWRCCCRAADANCDAAWMQLYRVHGDHRLSVAGSADGAFCLEKSALAGDTGPTRKLGALMLRAATTLADTEAPSPGYQAAIRMTRTRWRCCTRFSAAARTTTRQKPPHRARARDDPGWRCAWRWRATTDSQARSAVRRSGRRPLGWWSWSAQSVHLADPALGRARHPCARQGPRSTLRRTPSRPRAARGARSSGDLRRHAAPAAYPFERRGVAGRVLRAGQRDHAGSAAPGLRSGPSARASRCIGTGRLSGCRACSSHRRDEPKTAAYVAPRLITVYAVDVAHDGVEGCLATNGDY